MNERSGARERCAASERRSGGANGPVLYASISYASYPMCDDANKTGTDKNIKVVIHSSLEVQSKRIEAFSFCVAKGKFRFYEVPHVLSRSAVHTNQRGTGSVGIIHSVYSQNCPFRFLCTYFIKCRLIFEGLSQNVRKGFN